MDISTISIPDLVTYFIGLVVVLGGGAGGVAFLYKSKFFKAISSLITIISSLILLLEQMIEVFSVSMTAIVRAMSHIKTLAEKAKIGLEDNKLTPEEWSGLIDELLASVADLNAAKDEAEKIYPPIETIIKELYALKQTFNPLVG
jgi:hypothetical protein